MPVTSRPLRPVTPHDLTYPDYTTFMVFRKKNLRKFPILTSMPNWNRMTVICELNSHAANAHQPHANGPVPHHHDGYQLVRLG